MVYFPLFDLYKQHQKWINSFLLQGGFYVFTYIVDKYLLFATGKDVPILSLVVFVLLFLSARLFIRAKKAEKYFGGFTTFGPYYAAFLGVFSWVLYLLVYRLYIRN